MTRVGGGAPSRPVLEARELACVVAFAVVALVGCRRSSPPPAPSSVASVEVSALPPAEAGAVASSAPPPVVDAGAQPRDACLRKNQSIRSADWSNCSFGAFGKLRDGRSEAHEYDALGGPHDTIITKLIGVGYGDVDGDGIEDAVVAITERVHYARGKNTSEHGHVYVYSTKEGFVALVASALGGRPMTSLEVVKDRILLDDATPWETCKTELVVRDAKLDTARERCTKKP